MNSILFTKKVSIQPPLKKGLNTDPRNIVAEVGKATFEIPYAMVIEDFATLTSDSI